VAGRDFKLSPSGHQAAADPAKSWIRRIFLLFRRFTGQGRKPASDASRPAALCRRLMGLETEYAVHLDQGHPEQGHPEQGHPEQGDIDQGDIDQGHLKQLAAGAPTAREVYGAIAQVIRREMPAVAATDDPTRWFLANGASLSLETHALLREMPGGLIEMATPEVTCPSDLLTCQRAIDRMMEHAADEVALSRPVRLLKNSRDAIGHTYGCQENYECEVANGLTLGLYRIAILLLWLVQMLCLLAAAPVLTLLVLATGWRVWRQPALAGDADAQFRSLPRWFTTACVTALRLAHRPLAIGLRLVTCHLAFRRQRRYLTGLLISRVALCGTGHLDRQGCFFLSGKACSIDRVTDLGGFQGERPIFVFGHWLAQLFGHSLASLWQTRGLLARRQRLQIGLADSNLSDLAELVKIGSVALVLDMIESGETSALPTVRRPLRSLAVFNRDWNLVRRIKTSHGLFTSLELQACYWKAARHFVAQRQQPFAAAGQAAGTDLREARRILEFWGEAIDCVREFRIDGHQTRQGLGRIDWLGKRWMLDQLGPRATYAARKKVDLRYHELSSEGYWRRIPSSSRYLLVDPAEIASRRRSPPPDSPAAHRAWWIREFADSSDPVSVDWHRGTVGVGKDRRWSTFAGATSGSGE